MRNFATSWKNRLVFYAIIHEHGADLMLYDKLSKFNAMYNLNNAFSIAEKEF